MELNFQIISICIIRGIGVGSSYTIIYDVQVLSECIQLKSQQHLFACSSLCLNLISEIRFEWNVSEINNWRSNNINKMRNACK